MPKVPHLAAQRATFMVQHHPHHDLLQVRTMVFEVTLLAEALATLALEDQKNPPLEGVSLPWQKA